MLLLNFTAFTRFVKYCYILLNLRAYIIVYCLLDEWICTFLFFVGFMSYVMLDTIWSLFLNQQFKCWLKNVSIPCFQYWIVRQSNPTLLFVVTFVILFPFCTFCIFLYYFEIILYWKMYICKKYELPSTIKIALFIISWFHYSCLTIIPFQLKICITAISICIFELHCILICYHCWKLLKFVQNCSKLYWDCIWIVLYLTCYDYWCLVRMNTCLIPFLLNICNINLKRKKEKKEKKKKKKILIFFSSHAY